MALVVADRVKETTTTTGTGAYDLAGAETSFQAFGDVLSNNDTTYYAVTDGTYWEVGIGTYNSTDDELARTTILESSNSDAAVNWTAGSKQIFLTIPAERSVYRTDSNSAGINITGTARSVDAPDDTRSKYGDNDELEIYHSGNNSFIFADSTLVVNYENGFYLQTSNNGESSITAVENGEVALWHDNSKTLKTTSTGVDITGNIVVSGTVDGVDIATRDATLTSTTTTANAALPKAGGTMTGSIRLDQEDKTGSGGTLTLDLSAANNFKISMTADTTIAFSNKSAGYGGNLIFVQDATGGHDFTLPSECLTPVNGAAIVQNTGANEIAILSYYVLSSTQILVNYIGDFA